MRPGVLGSTDSKDFRDGCLDFKRKWGCGFVSWRGTEAKGGGRHPSFLGVIACVGSMVSWGQGMSSLEEGRVP